MKGTRFRTSLAVRSLVAAILFAGYYVLAFAVASALCLVPYVGALLRLPLNFYVGVLYLACIGAAVIILWSVIPRPQRFKAPGPLLTPRSDPRLFEEIFRLARELGQKAPGEAYLMPDISAWVSRRGGFMGIGGQRIVGVGLTLLEVLSVNEFRCVLAHEFGHFRSGDTWLGSWIYRTRSTIGRTIQQLPVLSGFGKTAAGLGELVRQPFILYGNWFMRVTQAISRHQESLADELAAATAGRETAISTLRQTFIAHVIYSGYWETILIHVLNAGYLPSYAAGFGEFAGFAPNQELATKALNWQIEHVQSQPHDSHPSLGERIKALEALPPGRSPETAPPAISLMEDVPRRERELFTFISPEAGPKLKPIDWDDVTPLALVPFWAKLAKLHEADLAGLTPKGLVDRLPGLADLGRQMSRTAGQPQVGDEFEDLAKSNATGIITVALATKMIERGWQATGGPGRYTVLRLGERTCELFRVVREFAEGKMAPDDWLKLCDELGIGDLELGPGGPVQGGEAAAEGRPVDASASDAMPPAAPAAEGQGRPRQVSPVLIAAIIMVVIAGIAGIFSLIGTGGDSGTPFIDLSRPGVAAPSANGNSWSKPTVRQSSGTEIPFSLARTEQDLVAKVTRTSSRAGAYEVEGTILNRGARTYHFVMVEVELLDVSGRVVGRLRNVAQREEYIVPGSLRPFKVQGRGRPNWQTARASVVYSVAVE